jgi:hypothetical protein
MFIGCNDDYDTGPYWGRVSAFKNGASWSGEIRGSEQSGLLGLTFDRIQSDGLLLEDIFIDRIPKEVGLYTIPMTDTLRRHQYVTGIYFTLQGGDVLEGVYYLDPSATNFVEIVSTNRGIYKGRFQVSFVIDSMRHAMHPYLPETVVFTDGEFKTKVLLRK